MGTPPSSLNCLVGAFFLDLPADGAPEGGDMRVPSPAAGTMTNTFIGAISIVQGSKGLCPFPGYWLLLLFRLVFAAAFLAWGSPVSDPCCWRDPRNKLSVSSYNQNNCPPLA